MSQPLSICFISQEYPEETGWGGIGTYTHQTAHALAKRGHQIFVITRALQKTRVEEEADGVRVYRVLPRFSLNHLPFIWRVNFLWEGHRLAVADAVCDIQRSAPIDLIEVPDIGAEVFIYQIMKAKKPPVVVRLHSAERAPSFRSSAFNFRKKLDDSLEKRMIEMAAAVSSPSMAVMKFRNPGFLIPPNKSEVIGNPLDTKIFSPSPAGSTASNFEILFLGRFHPVKGVDVLLKAVPKIFETVPEATLTLIGAGMGKSENQTSDSILPKEFPEKFLKRIKILKRISHGSLPEFYRGAALSVVPSRWEPFGYTAIEAMACAKAVVASNIGGLAENIEDGVSGILVPPEDPEALAGAVIRLLKNPGLRESLGRNAREQVVQKFSHEAIIPQLEEFYRRVISSYLK